jgi:hypothetical protein
MSEQVHSSTRNRAEDVPGDDTTTTARENSVDHSETDELLDEIDALLNEINTENEARDKEDYKAKLRSISFMGRRALDPCANVVRVPEDRAEALLREGLAREPDCSDCN